MLLAALIVVGCAGAAWVYLSGGRVTSSAGAALDSPSPGGGTDSARPQDPSALTASPDPSYGADPPRRQKPPSAAYSDEPPVNIDRDPAQGISTSAVPTEMPGGVAPESSDGANPLAPSTPVMSSVNVDRITAAIGENARAKADSLGRKTITVKAPDFQKP